MQARRFTCKGTSRSPIDLRSTESLDDPLSKTFKRKSDAIDIGCSHDRQKASCLSRWIAENPAPVHTAAPRGKLTRISILGKGTFGRVYKVVDEAGNQFAQKISFQLNIYGASRELSITSAFQGHPNIIRCHGFKIDTSARNYSMVMELMEGNLVNFWSKSPAKKRLEHIKSIAHQILSGVAYLHSGNVAHRDIKSDNILYRTIGDRLEVKVGIVFHLSALQLADLGLSRVLSKCNSNQVITAPYKPPELLLIDKNIYYGLEIDIWSVGMVLCEIILGYTIAGTLDGDCLVEKLATIFDLTRYNFSYKEGNEACGVESYLTKHVVTGAQTLDPLLIDLLKRILDVDPEARISAEAALAHPYFNGLAPPTRTAPVPRPRFLEHSAFDWTTKHDGLTARMRAILVEWLKDLTLEFNCNVETFAQCVIILDAFMTKTTKRFQSRDLQLVGGAVFMLNNALHEIEFQGPDMMAYMSAHTYTAKQVEDMSYEIFACLEYTIPRTALSKEVIGRNSENDMYDTFRKLCSSTIFFPLDVERAVLPTRAQ